MTSRRDFLWGAASSGLVAAAHGAHMSGLPDIEGDPARFRLLVDGDVGAWVFPRRKHPVFFAVGAAKSAFALYPQDDLGVIVLSNLSADLWLPFGRRALIYDRTGRMEGWPLTG